MSKISILLPTYKPGDYIVRCLESIELQTLDKSQFRVYIALNGSDKTFEDYLKKILQNFNFNYVTFFLDKAGVSHARNFLIDNSTEEFVVFIDDDDLISKNYLEELFQASNNDIMGIANVYNFEENSNKLIESYIGKCFKSLEQQTESKLISRKYYSSPCAKMIHRDIIGEVRFDTKLAIGEDSLFMAQLSHRVKSVYKTDETACYYVCEREGSATRQKINKKKELKRIVYLLNEYIKMLLNPHYDRLFISTRIIATLLHGKRLFK